MISIKTIVPHLAILSLALLAACGDDTPTSTGPGANVAPKAGSTYTFNRVDLDSNRVKVAGSDTSYSMSVVSTGNSFGGKSNLVMLRQDSNDIFVSYESNGDFAILPKADDSTPEWLVFPAGSKTTFNMTPVDTTIENPFGGVWELSTRGSIAYAGTESVTVPAGTFQTHKFVQTITFSLGIGADKNINTTVNTLYYTPSIGWTVKVVERTESDNPGFPPSGTEEVLASYSLK